MKAEMRFGSMCALAAAASGLLTPVCAQTGHEGTLIVLAAGQRISVVDAANPGVHIEIVAPGAQALPLNDLLTAIGRTGVSAALGQRNRNANTLVMEDGRLLFRSLPATAPSVAQEDANTITVAGGHILFDRGRVTVSAERVTQSNGGVSVNPALQEATRTAAAVSAIGTTVLSSSVLTGTARTGPLTVLAGFSGHWRAWSAEYAGLFPAGDERQHLDQRPGQPDAQHSAGRTSAERLDPPPAGGGDRHRHPNFRRAQR